jgi:hypothetical protein
MFDEGGGMMIVRVLAVSKDRRQTKNVEENAMTVPTTKHPTKYGVFCTIAVVHGLDVDIGRGRLPLLVMVVDGVVYDDEI